MKRMVVAAMVAGLGFAGCETMDAPREQEATVGSADTVVTTAGRARNRKDPTRSSPLPPPPPPPPPPPASIIVGAPMMGGAVSELALLSGSGDYQLDTIEGETVVEGETITYQPDADGYVRIEPQFETVQEVVVTQEAATELVVVPPVYDAQGNLRTPASTVERVIPPVSRVETRQVQTAPGETVFTDGKPLTRRVDRTVRRPDRYVLRDHKGRIIREFASREEFAEWQPNPYKRAETEPVSTFSADVDTASYSLARQSLDSGRLPPPQSVRLEEMVNYFDYNYEVPRSKREPFKPTVAVAPSPWNAETKLVHIGIKGYDVPARKRPPMNLVFLVDVSGSMNNPAKLGLLKQSFRELVGELDREDRVSIVTYASGVDTPLIPTRGDRRSDILRVVDSLNAAGSTSGEAGLQTAYRVAEQSFIKNGTNRVILATDGDFNVGISSPDELKRYIEDKRDTGVYLSVLGFGRGNLQDDIMQALAQNGNGIAAYVDSRREARKLFVEDLGKSLVPIADDVKIQVEFNPARVREYRLLGYETRGLKREDFNNDRVDAGDIGAGHTVTAMYEIVPTEAARRFVEPLRYQTDPGTTRATGANPDEYGYVKLRYKRPGEAVSQLMERAITVGDESDTLRAASADTRFATAVAGFALSLRGDAYADELDLAELARLARESRGDDRYGYRQEFVDLVETARRIRSRTAMRSGP